MQAELVERASQGDLDAFESLAASIVDRFYTLAFRILRDPGLQVPAT
jgi:DNA-directed RNA polymerase specialized sigma24 family protein